MYIDYVLDCQYAESFLVHLPSGVNSRIAIWLNLVSIATTTYHFGWRHVYGNFFVRLRLAMYILMFNRIK